MFNFSGLSILKKIGHSQISDDGYVITTQDIFAVVNPSSAFNDFQTIISMANADEDVDIPFPAAYWSMDNADIVTYGSSTYIMDLVDGYNGIITGTSAVIGQIGQARDFNGTTDYIEMGDEFNNIIAGSNKKFSISAWIKPDSSGTFRTIVSKYSDSSCSEDGRQIILRLNSSNELQFVYSLSLTSGNLTEVSSTSVINNTSIYYHVTATYDGSIDSSRQDRVKLYINGIEESTSLDINTGTFPGNIPAGTAHFGVGSTVNSAGALCGFPWSGEIDEVALWDVVLTSEQIEEVYRLGATNQRLTANIFK